MIRNKKRKGGGRRRDQKSRTRLCFSLSFFLLTCQTHKAGEGDQGQRDGGGARVDEKKIRIEHKVTSNN